MKSYSDALPNIEKEVVTRTLDESVKARELIEFIDSHLDETHEDIRQLTSLVIDRAEQIEASLINGHTSLVEVQNKVDSLTKRTNYLIAALIVEFAAVVYFAGVVTGYIPSP